MRQTVVLPHEERHQDNSSAGKRSRRAAVAPGINSSPPSISSISSGPGAMSLRDELSGRLFLVDSGADVSVFPAAFVKPSLSAPKTSSSSSASTGSLVAANGSAIKTFGTTRLPLRFKTLRVEHSFLVADVPRPILGSDFFSLLELLIDIKNRQLVRLPRISTSLAVVPAVPDDSLRSVSVSGLHAPRANAVEALLDKFPHVLVSTFDSTAPPAHGVRRLRPS